MNKDIRNALIGIALVVLLIVPAVLGFFSGWGSDWGMMSGMMTGFGWGMFTIIGMVVFWGLVVGGIVLLVRGITSVGRSKKEASFLEILKGRYARGEISKEEFEETRKNLF